MGNRRAPRLAECIEEPPQSRSVTTLRRPHQPARIVIDDHRQILVALLVGDLVDPDSAQTIETIEGLTGLRPDPVEDGTDRAPAICVNSHTADFEQRVANQATVSSKALVCRAPCRAQGTAATTTPCSPHDTRGSLNHPQISQ